MQTPNWPSEAQYMHGPPQSVLLSLTEHLPQPSQSPGWQMVVAQSPFTSEPSGWFAQVWRAAHCWQKPQSAS